jgi:nucleoside-diphosphate-sugar epimerase
MILVTGASGVMGSVLVSRLHEKGLPVRACVLPGDPLVGRIRGLCRDIRFGDVAEKSSITGICSGVTTVYHLAAVILSPEEDVFERVNVVGTRNLVDEARRAGVGHFIYVSSASVTYPRPTPYSISKRKAEDFVTNSGLRYTIVRPTLVYGPSGGQEFDKYLDYLAKFPFVPFIGNGRAMKRPVFVDDVNDGLAAVCGRAESYGKTYNVSGGEAISMLDFTRLCLRLLGTPRKPVIRFPVGLCRLAALIMRLFAKDPPLKWQTIAGIIQDANLDPSLAMEDLGYSPAKVTDMLPKCFPRKSGCSQQRM